MSTRPRRDAGDRVAGIGGLRLLFALVLAFDERISWIVVASDSLKLVFGTHGPRPPPVLAMPFEEPQILVLPSEQAG